MAFNLTWKYGRIPKDESNDMTDEEREHTVRVVYSDGSSILAEDEVLDAYGFDGLWRLTNN